MKNKTTICMIAVLAIIVAILLAILITSSKGYKIKKLEKFTNLVEQKYDTYSAVDLEKAQAKYEKLVKKVEKKELSGEDQILISELKGRCKGSFAQAKARLILEDFKNAVDEAGDDVKGVIESMKE
ncbi:MAG: hypothetical protein IKU03_06255 [Bacteroidales bacterium]|nr:hypothetical protein [Bacteroidales bacterium]